MSDDKMDRGAFVRRVTAAGAAGLAIGGGTGAMVKAGINLFKEISAEKPGKELRRDAMARTQRDIDSGKVPANAERIVDDYDNNFQQARREDAERTSSNPDLFSGGAPTALVGAALGGALGITGRVVTEKGIREQHLRPVAIGMMAGT